MKVDVIYTKNGKPASMAERYVTPLEKLGLVRRAGTYQAAVIPKAPNRAVMSAAQTPDPSRVAAVAADLERDDAGQLWNADLHVSTRAKTLEGLWRRKPGKAPTEE